MLIKFQTRPRIMATTRERPHVMQRPHKRLTQRRQPLKSIKRQITLVNPMQMYHVRLPDKRMTRQVPAITRNREIITHRPVTLMRQYPQPLLHEVHKVHPTSPSALTRRRYPRHATPTLLHKHRRLHATPVKRLMYPAHRHSRPATSVRLIYVNNFHNHKNNLFQSQPHPSTPLP